MLSRFIQTPSHGGILSGESGDRGSEHPSPSLENHKLLTCYTYKVSLEFWYKPLLEMQLDTLDLSASLGRSVRPSVKYVDD